MRIYNISLDRWTFSGEKTLQLLYAESQKSPACAILSITSPAITWVKDCVLVFVCSN